MARTRVGRSSESATRESTMPHRGVVALQMPARVDGIVSSAYEKRENGSALRRKAATVR